MAASPQRQPHFGASPPLLCCLTALKEYFRESPRHLDASMQRSAGAGAAASWLQPSLHGSAAVVSTADCVRWRIEGTRGGLVRLRLRATSAISNQLPASTMYGNASWIQDNQSLFSTSWPSGHLSGIIGIHRSEVPSAYCTSLISEECRQHIAEEACTNVRQVLMQYLYKHKEALIGIEQLISSKVACLWTRPLTDPTREKSWFSISLITGTPSHAGPARTHRPKGLPCFTCCTDGCPSCSPLFEMIPCCEGRHL